MCTWRRKVLSCFEIATVSVNKPYMVRTVFGKIKFFSETKKPLFQDTPKPLLPVSGAPIVTHWLRQLRKLETNAAPSEVAAVVNDANFEAFKKWAAKMASEEKQEVLDVYMQEQKFFRNILFVANMRIIYCFYLEIFL